ncbi:MAG: DUF4883 family protein [Clostridiaceae bacterium]
MKKILLIVCFVFMFFISSCSYVRTKTKPEYDYYTISIKDNIKLEQPKIKILDTNYYKNEYLDQDSMNKVLDFLNALSENNYVDKDLIKDKKPVFRLYMEFSEDSYVINIYDENYISIFPNDGDYDEDYISMNKIYKSLNLFYLCKNYINLK